MQFNPLFFPQSVTEETPKLNFKLSGSTYLFADILKVYTDQENLSTDTLLSNEVSPGISTDFYFKPANQKDQPETDIQIEDNVIPADFKSIIEIVDELSYPIPNNEFSSIEENSKNLKNVDKKNYISGLELDEIVRKIAYLSGAINFNQFFGENESTLKVKDSFNNEIKLTTKEILNVLNSNDSAKISVESNDKSLNIELKKIALPNQSNSSDFVFFNEEKEFPVELKLQLDNKPTGEKFGNEDLPIANSKSLKQDLLSLSKSELINKLNLSPKEFKAESELNNDASIKNQVYEIKLNVTSAKNNSVTNGNNNQNIPVKELNTAELLIKDSFNREKADTFNKDKIVTGKRSKNQNKLFHYLKENSAQIKNNSVQKPDKKFASPKIQPDFQNADKGSLKKNSLKSLDNTQPKDAVRSSELKTFEKKTEQFKNTIQTEVKEIKQAKIIIKDSAAETNTEEFKISDKRDLGKISQLENKSEKQISDFENKEIPSPKVYKQNQTSVRNNNDLVSKTTDEKINLSENLNTKQTDKSNLKVINISPKYYSENVEEKETPVTTGSQNKLNANQSLSKKNIENSETTFDNQPSIKNYPDSEHQRIDANNQNENLTKKENDKETIPVVTKPVVKSFSSDEKNPEVKTESGKEEFKQTVQKVPQEMNNNSFENNFEDKNTNNFFAANPEKNIDVKNIFQNNSLNDVSETIKEVSVEKLVEEFSKLASDVEKKSIVLKIVPEHLGKVKMSLNISENKVHANIEVENEAVKNTIQNNSDNLKHSLTQQGLQLSSLNISLSNSEQKTEKSFSSKKKSDYEKKVDEIAVDKEDKKVYKNFGYNTYEYLA